MEVKPTHLEKQLSPNEVTDEGISMEVKPTHLEKQLFLNEVTDEGIETEVKLLQPKNLLLVDYQYYTF